MPHQHILAGADLQDGAFTDADGVYHRVLRAVVEAQPGQDCCGIVSISGESLHLKGQGDLASASLSFLQQ